MLILKIITIIVVIGFLISCSYVLSVRKGHSTDSNFSKLFGRITVNAFFTWQLTLFVIAVVLNIIFNFNRLEFEFTFIFIEFTTWIYIASALWLQRRRGKLTE